MLSGEAGRKLHVGGLQHTGMMPATYASWAPLTPSQPSTAGTRSTLAWIATRPSRLCLQPRPTTGESWTPIAGSSTALPTCCSPRSVCCLMPVCSRISSYSHVHAVSTCEICQVHQACILAEISCACQLVCLQGRACAPLLCCAGCMHRTAVSYPLTWCRYQAHAHGHAQLLCALPAQPLLWSTHWRAEG